VGLFERALLPPKEMFGEALGSLWETDQFMRLNAKSK